MNQSSWLYTIHTNINYNQLFYYVHKMNINKPNDTLQDTVIVCIWILNFMISYPCSSLPDYLQRKGVTQEQRRREWMAQIIMHKYRKNREVHRLSFMIQYPFTVSFIYDTVLFFFFLLFSFLDLFYRKKWVLLQKKGHWSTVSYRNYY